MYGRMRDGVAEEDFATWRQKERERMKLLMRERRAALRAARQGEPIYPEHVLASMTRWIDAHRDKARSRPLASVVDALRQSGRREGLAEDDWDRIQDRGTAKLLRSMGFELFRSGPGMVVVGLRP
jgi:hypothetical protein